jgi:hypothetical protein
MDYYSRMAGNIPCKNLVRLKMANLSAPAGKHGMEISKWFIYLNPGAQSLTVNDDPP